MTQPDFEALKREVVGKSCRMSFTNRDCTCPHCQAAAQVLREAFEAQLAEVRAERTAPVRGLIDRVDRQEAALADRDQTITDLQAREAEHLATIERLRDFVQGMINLLSDPKVIRWDDTSPNRLHLDGIAHEGPPVDFMFKVFDLLLRHARTALNGETDHG